MPSRTGAHVPVTAKLSRRFYDQLGDDVATELVDWFNAVDNDYKTDLKDLNDRNWERFRAELQAELAKQRAELIKWMFIFWSGTVIPMVGIFIGIVALLR
ncbi:MAG: hypothetical protein ACSLFK_10590 [Gemmatimonadaceae bacterium]